MAAFRERLDELARDARITLSENELERFEQYYALLERWNRTMNLTALPLRGYPTPTLRRLYLESMVASRLVPTAPLTWLDFGTGGGSPAIPLKILRPAARLTMVESRERKAAFLREAVRALGLEDISVVGVRFEDLTPAHTGSVDLVTSRAVKADDVLWKTCTRLLTAGGRLLLFATATTPVAIEGFRVIDKISVPGTEAAVLSFARVFHVEQR